ncbi:MAG: TonB-dependent receptor, partial [Vicinamibacterales bacterium]
MHTPADVRRVYALLLGFAVATGSSAAAQTTIPPYRQTVVVTAATTPVEMGTVTRTLTVITREQIEALPAHSVADILRLAASVDVRARGVRGMQTDFAIRGANFGQMLVLVDGVRLNDAQSGHHNGDIPVSLDEVERIEILHGPGSALFGAD